MQATAEANTTAGMPGRPEKMTPKQFGQVIKKAKLANMSVVARTLGVSRSHVYRLLKGETVIDEAMALLIREKLPPKKKA